MMRRILWILSGVLLMSLGLAGGVGGIQQWIHYSYLWDMTRAGDGIGQIPLFQGIEMTGIGVVLLLLGAFLAYKGLGRASRSG